MLDICFSLSFFSIPFALSFVLFPFTMVYPFFILYPSPLPGHGKVWRSWRLQVRRFACPTLCLALFAFILCLWARSWFGMYHQNNQPSLDNGKWLFNLMLIADLLEDLLFCFSFLFLFSFFSMLCVHVSSTSSLLSSKHSVGQTKISLVLFLFCFVITKGNWPISTLLYAVIVHQFLV